MMVSKIEYNKTIFHSLTLGADLLQQRPADGGRGGTEVSMAALVGIIGSCHIFVTATTWRWGGGHRGKYGCPSGNYKELTQIWMGTNLYTYQNQEIHQEWKSHLYHGVVSRIV